ncbi:hypothetical protein VKT23_012565 [Stygiomarasmius scandens]|uniref:Cytochrome P450 n=1 Tax=Marasmiellus scandens TaxID=2682957 RepID=A0ABR1J853_9AGAR
MTFTTPGLYHLGRTLAILTTPFVLTALLDRFVLQPLNVRPASWVLITTSILVLPALLFVRILYRRIVARSRAAALGARLVPVVEGRWPGNLDIPLLLGEARKTGYPGDGFWDFINKYGPTVNIHMLGINHVFTTNPDHIQRVLASNFNNHVKGDTFQFNMRSVLGVGVFNSDGDMWKFHRSMTRPFFNRDKITRLELFDRHAEHVVVQMKRRLKEGYPIDFQDLMGRFTLDSATEFLFGSCFHSLRETLPYPHNAPESNRRAAMTEAESFATAFLACQEIVSQREDLGHLLWPFFEILQDKSKEPMKVVGGHIEKFVREALKKSQSAEKTEEKTEEGIEETLLDQLVSMTDDPKLIKDEVLNILIAGRDTTAGTLSFIIYLLSIHPKVLSKLREEISLNVGKDPRRKLTFEGIRGCKYLRAVINETLRLFPIVPFNVRETIHEETLPSPDPNLPPLYIPANTRIGYSVFMMHRRKDLWGPDAEEFDPERFLDERYKKYLAPKPFIFLPFNAGPRICLGQQFAYNEMSLMVIRLVQHFSSFTFDEEACPPDCRASPEWAALKDGSRKSVDRIRPQFALTLSIAGGLWIKAKEAEGEV